MFKQRLISGIILVLITFVTLYYGGFLTFFVVGAISLIGVFELLRVIQMEKSALGVIVYTHLRMSVFILNRGRQLVSSVELEVRKLHWCR